MVSLFALYQRPEDEKEFLTHYVAVHVPLAQKMPGLLSLEWGATEGLPTVPQDPWFLVAEMRFATRETLYEALRSPEGREAALDIEKFAHGLVTMRMVQWHE